MMLHGCFFVGQDAEMKRKWSTLY